MVDPANSGDGTATISSEDIDAALRLLAEEQRRAPVSWASLVTFALNSIIGIGVIAAIPLIFLAPSVATYLVIVGLVTFGLLQLLKRLKPQYFGWETPDDRRLDKANRAMTRRAGEIWQQEFTVASASFRFAGKTFRYVLILFLVFIAGGLWFALNLVTGANPFGPLALIALTFLLMGVPTAYYQQRYETAVGRMAKELLARKAQAEASGTVEIPRKDYDLLSRIEVRQSVQTAVHSLPDQLQKLNSYYAVVIDAAPQQFLTQLREQDSNAGHALRELTDSLQSDHQPPNATPSTSAPNEFSLETDTGYRITYRVHDAQQRIDITRIEHLATAGASRGS